MTREEIQTIFERVLTWPSERLDDVADILLHMEAANDTADDLTQEDLVDLQEGLAEAERGEFASEEEIQTLFNRYRR